MRIVGIIFLLCLFGCCRTNIELPHALNIGCFSLLPEVSSPHIYFEFTPEKCFTLCWGMNSTFAGFYTKNSEKSSDIGYCYCEKGVARELVPQSKCRPCRAHPTKTCGGENLLSFYQLSKVASGRTAGEGKLLVGNELGVEVMPDRQELLHTSAPVSAIDYHFKRSEGFAASNHVIYRYSLEGASSGENDTKFLTNVGYIVNCEVFTLDWVHDRLYWPDCWSDPETPTDIRMAGLEGTDEDSLIVLTPGLIIADIVVDPYKGFLFWTANSTLSSCGLDGRDIMDLRDLSPAQEVTTLALDMVEERVYFTGYLRNSADQVKHIFYTPYRGSAVYTVRGYAYDQSVVHITLMQSQLFYLTRKGETQYVLWQTDQINSSKPVRYLDVNEEIFDIKLLDPAVQSPPHGKVNACADRGCSHHCVLESSLAVCRCPRRWSLTEDDKTCKKVETKKDLFLTVMKGVMLVLVLLLVAGVLMCICDKLWTNIHPTVVRLADAKVFKQPVIYRRRRDSENLI